MAYQIDQNLANGVYDATNSIEVGRDADDLPILWTKAALEKDADGNPTKYLEYSNPSTGYYGAVYTNNKGDGMMMCSSRGFTENSAKLWGGNLKCLAE